MSISITGSRTLGSYTRKAKMDEFIKLTLSVLDVGQILDGLEQRRIIWQATAEYLGAGCTDLSDSIEECSDPNEAQGVADYYQYLIDTIEKQRDTQLDQKRDSTSN